MRVPRSMAYTVYIDKIVDVTCEAEALFVNCHGGDVASETASAPVVAAISSSSSSSSITSSSSSSSSS